MDNIIITNKDRLNAKIKAIKKAGINSLHVISDFDRTLTHAMYKGEKTPSLISHLRKGKYLTENYPKKAQALFDKYHPIEISNKISREKKNRAMLKWWSAHYKLLVKSGLNERIIKESTKDILKEGKIRLREDSKEFFKKLKEKNIPLIILSSAGIGNSVTEFLKEQNMLYKNVHFVGNTLKFDKNKKFTGIKDNKIIHIFNKHESELKNLKIYKELLKRKNLILLGDSIGDLKMIEGFPYENAIKIGFFNYEEENLKELKQNFDIILLKDSNFKPINNILKKILG